MRGDAKTQQEGDEQNTRPGLSCVLVTGGTGRLCAGPMLLPEAAPRRYAICRSSVAVSLLLPGPSSSRLATMRPTRLSRPRCRSQPSTAAPRPPSAIHAVMARTMLLSSTQAAPAQGDLMQLMPSCSLSTRLTAHAQQPCLCCCCTRPASTAATCTTGGVARAGGDADITSRRVESSRVGASLCRQRGYRALARAPTRTPVALRFVRSRPCSLDASMSMLSPSLRP
jgi:hypothetical protein